MFLPSKWWGFPVCRFFLKPIQWFQWWSPWSPWRGESWEFCMEFCIMNSDTCPTYIFLPPRVAIQNMIEQWKHQLVHMNSEDKLMSTITIFFKVILQSQLGLNHAFSWFTLKRSLVVHQKKSASPLCVSQWRPGKRQRQPMATTGSQPAAAHHLPSLRQTGWIA